MAHPQAGHVRRLLARHDGPSRLDPRRDASLQHPASSAPPEHDGRARRGGPVRRRAAEGAERRRAPAARAASSPDDPAKGRGGLLPPRLGRGARPGRRAYPFQRARPAGLLHDEPRPVERELLRGAEGGARDGDQLDRQRRPHLPLAEHVRVEELSRSGSDDVLVQRLDRQRPGRLHRHQRRQQPARLDEVPLQGEEGRHEGRGRQQLPRAGDGAVLGTVQRGERPLRHQDRGPVLSRERRRRHRTAQRHPQVYDRARVGGPRLHRAALRGLRRLVGEPCAAELGGAGGALRCRAGGHGGAREDRGRGRLRRLRLVDGDHAARVRRGQRPGDREPRAQPRLRRPREVRPHADPWPFGGPGGEPRWALTRPRSPEGFR